MTYNYQEILSGLEKTILDGTNDFHAKNNEDFLKSLGKKLFNGLYNYAYGATKFVIIPDDEKIDFVIKIPYTGSSDYEDGWYSGTNNQYYHPGYDDYYPFENGTYEERPWDYCAIEVQRYAEATLNGFADCLAKTKFLGFVNDYPIYIQEKCETLTSVHQNHKYSEKEKSYTESLCKWWTPISYDWLTDFRLFFGDHKLKNFINFLHDYEWDDDLRNENIGYINNRPVLIDYASFLE